MENAYLKHSFTEQEVKILKTVMLRNRRLAIRWICTWYPLTTVQVRQHSRNIHWPSLARNQSLAVDHDFCRDFPILLQSEYNPFDSSWFREGDVHTRLIAFLDEFKYILNWKGLFTAPLFIEYFDEILERYEHDLNWSELTETKGLPITPALMFRYMKQWEMFSLIRNYYYVLSPDEWLEFNKSTHIVKDHDNYISDYTATMVKHLHLAMEDEGIDLESVHIYEEISDGDYYNEEDYPNPERHGINNLSRLKEYIEAQEESIKYYELYEQADWNLEMLDYIIDRPGFSWEAFALSAFISKPAPVFARYGMVILTQMVQESDFSHTAIGVNDDIVWNSELVDKYALYMDWNFYEHVLRRMEWSVPLLANHLDRFMQKELLGLQILYDRFLEPILEDSLLMVILGMEEGGN